MKFLKRSQREKPRVSLVLLDWRVRESIHLLHYLKTQTASRDSFEVIVVEYYDHHSSAVEKFASEVDTWVLLQMPDDCYYHKHLMYNAGAILSRGDIVMIGDSDAMVRPTFIERIIASFDKESLLVYHMDEFRNVRRDLYPFNYPSFEDVLGDGCINDVGGKTKGVLDEIDPIHSRNYGACMCARRDDIIDIGGADEDLTYLGHICGPYDMTFRLMNHGRRLSWDTEEYLFHTWHPGSDGADNYLGPHDGRNMSTTALQALSTGRVRPLVENAAIRALRTKSASQVDGELLDLLINPEYAAAFRKTGLGRVGIGYVQVSDRKTETVFATHKGFDVYQIAGTFYAVPEAFGKIDPAKLPVSSDDRIIVGQSFLEIREDLDSGEARLLETGSHANICAVGSRYAVVSHSLGPVDFRIRKNRSDSRIRWASTLSEARDLAMKTAQDVIFQARPGNAFETPSPKPQAVGTPYLAEHMLEINRRLTQLETQVSAIQNSRIWRTLVRIGGVIDKIRGRGRKSSTWYENSSRVSSSASGASQNR